MSIKKFRIIIIPLIILTGLIGTAYSQENDFRIGIFGAPTKSIGIYPYGVPTDPVYGGFNTSALNVYKADGFNVSECGRPDYWVSTAEMKKWIELFANNGIDIFLYTKDWYKANPASPGVYEGAPHSTLPGSVYFESVLGDHPNYKAMFDLVYSDPVLAETIWGFHLAEETTFFNGHNFTNSAPSWPYDFMETEIPLDKLLTAYDYFYDKREEHGLLDKKVGFWEANHYRAITQFQTLDHENNSTQFVAREVIEAMDEDAVFFEGSYTYFKYNSWWDQSYNDIYLPLAGKHYLGNFKSIDFAKQHHKSVMDVIGLETAEEEYPGDPGEPYEYDLVYHTDPSKLNYNWLWFQAYTSIIHGVDGIWFWTSALAWNEGEKEAVIDNLEETESLEEIYERENFPTVYKNGIGQLSRELGYLADQDILSTDRESILYTKTDHIDKFCIVPEALSYIPIYENLPTTIKSKVTSTRWNDEFRNESHSENYGLRYTIRTNGEEVVMIISNPLNVQVETILDFSNVANDKIKNSHGVDVLFWNGLVPADPMYKMDRDSDIDLVSSTVGEKVYKPISPSSQLPIVLGPMDVLILLFKSDPLPDYNNGWERVWANFGSGNIGDWGVRDGDKFYPGDFDGDGEEELFCVQTGDDAIDTWMSLLKFNGDSWELLWSNYGSTDHPMKPYRANLLVGDFNGDGKDELLGNDPDGWITSFHYASGNWNWGWSDYGSHPLTPYKNRLTVGDFDGDGKDEVLGWEIGGWTTMFNFVGSNWVWGDWSDFGLSHPIHPYRWEMYSGNFILNGRDDLLGFNNPPWPFLPGDAKTFHFNAGNWSSGWSTGGGTSFGGWTYPIPDSDKILIGNLDYIDAQDEIMFIQREVGGAWAATMDLKPNLDGWNWNWSANPIYGVPYIDDWSIDLNGGENTDYFLIKPNVSKPDHIIAMRRFGCEKGYKYDVRMYVSQLSSNKMADFDDENQIKNLDYSEMDLAGNNLDNSVGNFRIYPNPNNGTFKVEFILSLSDDINCELYDMSGKLIAEKYIGTLEEGYYSIDLSFDIISSGVYFLNLKGNNTYHQIKVTINQ